MSLSILARLGLSASATKPHTPSPLFMLALSLLMCFFAAQPLLLWLWPVDLAAQMQHSPTLTAFRQPEDGKPFFDVRMQRAPGLYGGLHVIPAVIWSVGMPLQHSARLRSQNRSLHRWAGRATLLSAVVLNVTGLLFIPLDLSYSVGTFELHRWGRVQWPSFNGAVLLVGIAWPATTVMAWRTARARQYEQHRRWATVHTAVGYVITFQRIGILLVGFVGTLASLSPPLATALNIPPHTAGTEAFEKERAAFAFGTWLALPWAAVWLWRLFPAASSQLNERQDKGR